MGRYYGPDHPHNCLRLGHAGGRQAGVRRRVCEASWVSAVSGTLTGCARTLWFRLLTDEWVSNTGSAGARPASAFYWLGAAGMAADPATPLATLGPHPVSLLRRCHGNRPLAVPAHPAGKLLPRTRRNRALSGTVPGSLSGSGGLSRRVARVADMVRSGGLRLHPGDICSPLSPSHGGG